MADAIRPGETYLSCMVRFCAIVTTVAVGLGPTSAAAQFVPPPPALEGRIPAPLPPPPQPPVISGPFGQAPPPGVYVPPRLNTYSDRAAGCLHQGRAGGLRGRRLQSYVRECANAD